MAARRFFAGHFKGICFAGAIGLCAIPEDPVVNSVKAEIHGIEAELKNWFCLRKVEMEKNKAIYAMLKFHNFVGLAVNNENLPDAQRVLWTDLVMGEPRLEDSLSVDARDMKADMYLQMFKEASDIENPCRIPGMGYLRCLQTHSADTDSNRRAKCRSAFAAFDEARKELHQQQADAIDSSIIKQNISDLRAQRLFERRAELLSKLERL